jgi:hypothetical protein
MTNAALTGATYDIDGGQNVAEVARALEVHLSGR